MSIVEQHSKPSVPTTTAAEAVEPRTGAEIFVECLARQGADLIFAYPGGASMPLHQVLTRYSDRIRTVLPRFEQGGGFGASGYARSTGKVGLCMATSGPGATNFVTCLADAKMDSTPIIAITGQVPTKAVGTDAFQETPIVEICRQITKHHYFISNPEEIPRIVDEAFYIARTGRPGPILIDFPKDIQNRRLLPNYDQPRQLPGYKPNRFASDEAIEQTLALLSEAKRPVIYAGGGVISAEAALALREFAERTRIPVTMTLLGLGAFDCNHYLALNMLGMHGTIYANYAVNEADLLLAWGVRFDDRVTGKVEEFAKHGKIVHVDIDGSELHKNKVVNVAAEGCVRDFIERLNQRLSQRNVVRADQFETWHRQIDDWKANEPLSYTLPPGLIVPQHAIKVLWEIVRDRGLLDDTYVSTGVGQHQMWAAQYWQFSQPRRWLTSGGLGTMGFGLPAAIGAQLAHPGKLVIDIDGDGSFLMNVQELATAHVENLPVKVLLLNNQHLGMVMQWEDRFFKGNRAQTYLGAGDHQPPYPDFVKMAESFNVAARQISRIEDLRSGLEEMIDTPGPFVLDVLVPHQEHVLPMIPSGQTVADMIKR